MSDVIASSQTETRTGRQSDEAAEQTKMSIIQAAAAEFAEHGFEGSSLRNIAKRAGTTHGLIRHHFGSKEDVFYAVADFAVEMFGEKERIAMGKLSPDDLKSPEALVAVHKEMLRDFARTSAENPNMMRILMHEGAACSPRLSYLYERIDSLNAEYAFFFEHLHKHNILPQFDANSGFLFVLTNFGLVFGLSEVSSHYVDGDILSEDQVDAHAERIIQTLYPNFP